MKVLYYSINDNNYSNRQNITMSIEDKGKILSVIVPLVLDDRFEEYIKELEKRDIKYDYETVSNRFSKARQEYKDKVIETAEQAVFSEDEELISSFIDEYGDTKYYSEIGEEYLELLESLDKLGEDSLITKLAKTAVSNNRGLELLLKRLNNEVAPFISKQIIAFLYTMIEDNNETLYVDKNGYILAFKAVATGNEYSEELGTYKPYKSYNAGTSSVNGVLIRNSSIPQGDGDIVTMPEGFVEANPHVACSTGLHAGTLTYASGFKSHGGKLILVQINPKDIISIPYDSRSQKIRCSKYKVLGEVEEDSNLSFVNKEYHDKFGIKRIEKAKQEDHELEEEFFKSFIEGSQDKFDNYDYLEEEEDDYDEDWYEYDDYEEYEDYWDDYDAWDDDLDW